MSASACLKRFFILYPVGLCVTDFILKIKMWFLSKFTFHETDAKKFSDRDLSVW